MTLIEFVAGQGRRHILVQLPGRELDERIPRIHIKELDVHGLSPGWQRQTKLGRKRSKRGGGVPIAVVAIVRDYGPGSIATFLPDANHDLKRSDCWLASSLRFPALHIPSCLRFLLRDSSGCLS